MSNRGCPGCTLLRATGACGRWVPPDPTTTTCILRAVSPDAVAITLRRNNIEARRQTLSSRRKGCAHAPDGLGNLFRRGASKAQNESRAFLFSEITRRERPQPDPVLCRPVRDLHIVQAFW